MSSLIKQVLVVFLVFTLLVPSGMWAAGPEPLDLDMMTRIRQEGFHNSQALRLLSELTDRIGARVTGSPSMKKANEWSRVQLSDWGLVNAHLESWGPFGRGWQEEFTSVRMMSPDAAMLWAIPRAWTPSTKGVVRAQVIRAADMKKYAGRLGEYIVLQGTARDLKPETEPPATRLTEQRLAEMAEYPISGGRGPAGARGRTTPQRSPVPAPTPVSTAPNAEKPLAIIEPSHFDNGMVTMSGTQAYKPGQEVGVPTLNMAIEHYNRIARLLDRDIPVELELNIQTRFFDNDPMSYNTIAEIPGTDKKDEIVMLGAHMDSWHGGTGATDNAAGVAACMEAVRILKAIGVKPRRTIRIALWSGEEQGLLGSGAYVAQHFASRPEQPRKPGEELVAAAMRPLAGPLQFKPDYARLAAYFNIDNGGGRFRGIYAQENTAVRPVFESWIEPLKDLGVSTVTMRNTGGTDFVPFDRAGLPGFQFIQDPLDYMAHTHHSNMDTYERVQPEDLMQQAVVMAWFVYNAAMRDQPLPRKPLPRTDQPVPAPRPTSAAR